MPMYNPNNSSIHDKHQILNVVDSNDLNIGYEICDKLARKCKFNQYFNNFPL
jgi:hypothetical protein